MEIIERIMKGKISADHLLYVSLKYTKTCDVILNLLGRWALVIDDALLGLLEKLKQKKKIKDIPLAPMQRLKIITEEFKKVKEINDVLPLYLFFKRIEHLKTVRESEFRKDVRLKILEGENTVVINIDTLNSYAKILESFISHIKQFILSK
jgi:hypothetical protein